jgi:hypothetical protein
LAVHEHGKKYLGRLALQEHGRPRPRIHATGLCRYDVGRLAEVELPVRLGQAEAPGWRRHGPVPRGTRSVRNARQGFHQQAAPRGARRAASVPAVSLARMGSRASAATGPVSSPSSMRMMATPVSDFAPHHGPLNGRRAPKLGQDRGVHVPRSKSWHREEIGRQDPAIGHHHEQIG